MLKYPHILSSDTENVWVCCRSLCSRCGGSDYASLLSVWWHGQHRLSHGVQWPAWVFMKRNKGFSIHARSQQQVFFFRIVWKSSDWFLDAAYRIHVHQSTVKVLRDLNLGYKLELRGKTEVKVGLLVKEGIFFSHPWLRLWPFLPIIHFPAIRERDMRRRIGWLAGTDLPNLCLSRLKSSLGRNNRPCFFDALLIPQHFFFLICASSVAALYAPLCNVFGFPEQAYSRAFATA